MDSCIEQKPRGAKPETEVDDRDCKECDEKASMMRGSTCSDSEGPFGRGQMCPTRTSLSQQY